MGQYVIKMPDIGEGIAEVELVHWYVKPGDVVAEEQVLADVMTDKANVEIPSPRAISTTDRWSHHPGDLPRTPWVRGLPRGAVVVAIGR